MTSKPSQAGVEPIEGFQYLPGYLDHQAQSELMAELAVIVAESPFFVPTMPRTGRPFSVRMTNCGSLGWVADTSGYRYQAHHPVTGRAWPAMPVRLQALWCSLLPTAPAPEACLINAYDAQAKLGLHRDADEADQQTPVLSISLGDTAAFVIGGLTRSAAKSRLLLHSGGVVVLGGAARRAYHGIDAIRPGTSRLVPWGGRLNLTLRRVTLSSQFKAPEWRESR